LWQSGSSATRTSRHSAPIRERRGNPKTRSSPPRERGERSGIKHLILKGQNIEQRRRSHHSVRERQLSDGCGGAENNKRREGRQSKLTDRHKWRREYVFHKYIVSHNVDGTSSFNKKARVEIKGPTEEEWYYATLGSSERGE